MSLRVIIQVCRQNRGHMLPKSPWTCCVLFFWNLTHQEMVKRTSWYWLMSSPSLVSLSLPAIRRHLLSPKILVNKWFYFYGIPACIHSDNGQSFENAIISRLYYMYNIKQSMTIPYNLCGNSICEWFNHTLLGLLQNLPKEQKRCRPSHVLSLVFTNNAMPHSITGYQPYELMFGHKTPTVCDTWFGLAHYNDQASMNKCVSLNEQHELLMSVNRWALKHIWQSS